MNTEKTLQNKKTKKNILQKLINKYKKNISPVANFLLNENKLTIENHFHKIIENTNYCDVLLGNGSNGKVYISALNKDTFNNIPYVIKQNIREETKGIKMLKYKNTLCLGHNNNLTSEMIALQFMKLHYHKTPHLHYIIDYSTCEDGDKVDKIFSELHGLKNSVKMYNKPIIPSGLYPIDEDTNLDVEMHVEKKTNLATLYELLIFIIYNYDKNNKTILLPNGINANVFDVLNYIFFSIVHTYSLLENNGIFVSDMHSGNIFVHWLEDNPNITYCSKNKKYSFSSNGFLIKIGDVGDTDVYIKKNVYLIGFYGGEIKNKILFVEKLKEKKNVNKIINEIVMSLPFKILTNTILFEYVKSSNIQINGDNIVNNDDINDMLSSDDIMENYFSDYETLHNEGIIAKYK